MQIPPDDEMHPEYGITWGDLRERIASIQRGEGIPHEEVMARIRKRLNIPEAIPAPPRYKTLDELVEEDFPQ